jgi:hypothetical protein
MSFGGHHAKEASDQLQKKLQEEAMADEIEKAVAGMKIRGDGDNDSSDDEKYRVPGYKPAPEEEPNDEKPEWMYAYAAGVMETVKDLPKEQLMSMLVDTKVQLQQAKTEASAAAAGATYKKGTWDPIHDKILKDLLVIKVKEDMETLQKNNPLALWWVVEWGKEYLARFRNATDEEVKFTPYSKSDLDNYQHWTNKKKDRPSMKVLAGMTATMNADSQPASGSVTPASVPATPASASSKKAKKSVGSPFD